MKTTGKVLVFLGLISTIFGLYLAWQRINPERISFNTPKFDSPNLQKKTNLTPIEIKMGEQSIDLPIYPASINGTSWETTTKGVSYLKNTPTPGEIGNSVMYGHNWTNLLGPLVRAKPGQKIEITYSDGSRKNFEITFTQTVSPDQTFILNNTNDRRITIYTCTGFLDSKRFVVVATLI